MAVTIEGYSVVVKKARLQELLETDAIKAPNATALGDHDIWRCCFMAENDALDFIRSLEALGLNASQGPDSDVVLVSEFDGTIYPYCEWLVTGRWENAVIAWKAGTRPEKVFAKEGWDPKIGSGLVFVDPKSMKDLEYLRLDGNVQVFRNKQTGKELYLGRTSVPVESLFKSAGEVVLKYLKTAGEKPVTGAAADEVALAVEMLGKVLAAAPNSWNALWLHGKAHVALGNYEIAYHSFHQAFELEKSNVDVPRELAGVCLELGKFMEAVDVAEKAVLLAPANAGLIGNLALAYLLAARIPEASKSIIAANRLDPNDEINQQLQQLIMEVAAGKRPQPKSLAELSAAPPKLMK